jgi:Cys-rich protein (TIGR01571 family)
MMCRYEGSMGQVMHRLKLNWLGGPAGHLKTIRTFQIVATLAVLYWITRSLFTWVYTLGKQGGTWMSNFTTDNGSITTGGIFLMMFFIGLTVFNLFFLIWSLCALTRTRMHVREKYGIRGSACGDFCCALWCRCCTVAQIHRHTGQYETHASVCCSKTGLHHGVNVV